MCIRDRYDAFVRALRKIYKVTLGRKFPMLTNYAVTIPPGGRTDAFVQTVITLSLIHIWSHKLFLYLRRTNFISTFKAN